MKPIYNQHLTLRTDYKSALAGKNAPCISV